MFKCGRPYTYSAAAIQMLLVLKQVYRLLQGFMHTLRELPFADLPVPNYTMLSRCTEELKIRLTTLRRGEPPHRVVDSTGAKFHGEGEWKLRKHGYSKRSTWRKVHSGLDAKTGRVRTSLMKHQGVADADMLPKLLEQIPADKLIDTLGCGASDTTKFRDHASHLPLRLSYATTPLFEPTISTSGIGTLRTLVKAPHGSGLPVTVFAITASSLI